MQDAKSRPHFYESLKLLAGDAGVTIMPIAGGLPVVKPGTDHIVGAVGASGGSAEQDVEVLEIAMGGLGLSKGQNSSGSVVFST